MRCFKCNSILNTKPLLIKGISHYNCPKCDLLRDPSKAVFVFNGGLSHHPARGKTCSIIIDFKTDDSFFIVEINDGTYEGCSLDNLELSIEQDL